MHRPSVNIHFPISVPYINVQKDKDIHTKIWNTTRRFTFITCRQHVPGGSGLRTVSPEIIQGLARKNRPIAGALYILCSGFMFAVMGALVRTASSSLPNEMIVFFRNFFALLFVIPVVIMRNGLPEIRTKRPLLHLLRTGAGLMAMYCYFFSLAHMKLAEAVLLSYTTPLFIPLIALAWLRESVPRTVRFAIIIGFVGVIFILKPSPGIFQSVSIIALMAGMASSFAMVTIRRMSITEPPGRIVFYYSLLSTVVSAVPLCWAWEMPQGSTFIVLIVIGLVAMIGQLLMTKGYSLAPAAQVGPFIYSTVVFATIIGWVLWGEYLDIFTWAGALLVCIAGVVSTRGTNIKADH